MTNLENVFGTQQWIIHKMLLLMRKRICNIKIDQGNKQRRKKSKCQTISGEKFNLTNNQWNTNEYINEMS